MAHPSAIKSITRSLRAENLCLKVSVLEILVTSCLVPGGRKKVLDAMTHYKEFAQERFRFQGIINDLDKNTGVCTDDLIVKTVIMSFINAVLSHEPDQESLEFRLHLRYEFIQLGLTNIVNKLRKHANHMLNKHLDLFDMTCKEDEKELARQFDVVLQYGPYYVFSYVV